MRSLKILLFTVCFADKPDADKEQRRKVHKMIRRVARENWHVIAGHMIIPILMMCLETYLKTINIYYKTRAKKGISESEADYKCWTYCVLLNIAQFAILYPTNNYFLDLMRAKLETHTQQSDNILRLISKERDFYSEHNQSSIIGAMEAIPQNTAGYIFGVAKETSLITQLIIQYTMDLFPNQYLKLFGMKEQAGSEGVENLFTHFAMVAASFGIRYLVRKLQKDKEHDEHFEANVSDLLDNVILVQNSEMHKAEAKKIQEHFIKDYYKSANDNFKADLRYNLFILPIVLHGIFKAHNAKNWKDGFYAIDGIWQEMQALRKFDQFFDEIPRFTNKINSLTRQTKLVDEAVTKLDAPNAKRVRFEKGEIDIKIEEFTYSTR